MYGYLNRAQKNIVQKIIQDQDVYDLGSGDFGLTMILKELGAARIAAIDKIPYQYPQLPHDPNIHYICGLFSELKMPEHIDITFLSWPVNYNAGILHWLKISSIVIYLGTNLNGTACGTPGLFKHLRTREILANEFDRRNELIVYGPNKVKREMLREERAAICTDKIVCAMEDNETIHYTIPTNIDPLKIKEFYDNSDRGRTVVNC
ncbi:MAG: hypothetical protein Q7R33_04860 [Nitrosarchaeum sp.]|nr:hypothetical protein [Nitrosarchaeum sp.]